MKSIFNQLDPQAPNHRNAYDLSQRHLFSLKVGQKAPVCCIETLPKDFFDIDLLSLVRSMPINTAAFTRLKCTFDFIFVPYQQLWHGWNQFFLQNEENMSSGDSFEHDALPRFDLIALIRGLLFNHMCYFAAALVQSHYTTNKPTKKECEDELGVQMIDSFGYDKALGAFRLLDLLGYGAFYNYVDWIDDWMKDSTTLAEMSSLLHEQSTWQGGLNALYDYLQNALTNPDGGFLPDYIVVSYDALNDTIKWLYEPDPNAPTTKVVLRSLWCNPFRILAYNKAWQDYTMNKRVQRYDAEKFNVDAHSVIPHYEMDKLLEMHYEAWDYDFFTGVFTSPQEGDVSLISGNSSVFFTPAPSGNSSAVITANQGKLVMAANNNAQSSIVGPSVYDIKRAEFLQRWKENHLRAGTKSQRQAMSQWNTHFRYLSDEYSDFITSVDMVINIDEVINTADNQGDISGKGIGTSDGHFKYECNDAGIIICMLSVKPRAEYDATMIDKQNICLQPFDFPSPFFDNLGLEAVPSYLLNLQHYNASETSNNIGYSVRYLPWKSAIDKVHGAFMSTYYTKERGAGGLSIWATPRKELANANYKDDIDTLFYVNPNVCDPIFVAAASSSQDTDHFLFNTNFLVRVVRNLSVSGMPTWNV